jgi:hypothetical protein
MISHISESSGIDRFEPRAPESGGTPIVWGIDDEHLHNYLLPRDCPRVTFYANEDSSDEDIERFLGSSRAVVAVESRWLEPIRSATLFRYLLPADTFECVDAGAGYYASENAVEPAAVEAFDDLLSELVRREVEVRFLPDLWHLHDAIAASTLQFSMIRMRNAAPRKMISR